MPDAFAALAEITPEMEAGKACELLGVKLEDVLAELEFRRSKRAANMRTEMALAAKAGGTRRIMREGEMDAHVDAMFHPTSYHYWGQRLGYQCWEDPAFVAEYKRDNPEARVRQRNVKTFGYRGVPVLQGKPSTRADRLMIKTVKAA